MKILNKFHIQNKRSNGNIHSKIVTIDVLVRVARGGPNRRLEITWQKKWNKKTTAIYLLFDEIYFIQNFHM